MRFHRVLIGIGACIVAAGGSVALGMSAEPIDSPAGCGAGACAPAVRLSVPTTTSPSAPTANDDLVIIGDSFAVGVMTDGFVPGRTLRERASTKYSDIYFDGRNGRAIEWESPSVSNGQTAMTRYQSQLGGSEVADTFVFVLGTNDIAASSAATPEGARRTMSIMNDRVWAINPDATIHWVNIYRLDMPRRSGIWDDTLDAMDREDNRIEACDWRSFIVSNTHLFRSDQVHYSGTGYLKLAETIESCIL